MGAQIFLVPKKKQNEGLPAPNFVFLEENYLTKSTFPDRLTFRKGTKWGGGIAPCPLPRCQYWNKSRNFQYVGVVFLWLSSGVIFCSLWCKVESKNLSSIHSHLYQILKLSTDFQNLFTSPIFSDWLIAD